MLKIALTGNIGSGKSTVARIFETLEVPVYNADNAGHNILLDKNVANEIAGIFGNNVIFNGSIDRKALANIVFDNQEALNKLNAIIHPRVIDEFFRYCTNNGNQKFVIFESALIFEADLSHFFDRTVLVYAPLEVKIKRVMKRDKCDKESVLKRISHQIDDDFKLQKTNDIIVNDDVALVIPQVLDLYEKYNL